MPTFVENVVVVAGMEGLGRPLDVESVHRPDIFASLSGLQLNASITPDSVAKALTDAHGGLKGYRRGRAESPC